MQTAKGLNNKNVIDNSDKYTDNGMSEQNARRAPRKPLNGVAKKQYRHRSNNVPKPANIHNRNLPNMPQHYAINKPNNFMKGSLISKNTNYSSKVIKSTTNSFKNAETSSAKSYGRQPSTRTLKQNSNDRLSYMNPTNNSDNRSYASHLIHEMRKNNFHGGFNNQGMNR